MKHLASSLPMSCGTTGTLARLEDCGVQPPAAALLLVNHEMRKQDDFDLQRAAKGFPTGGCCSASRAVTYTVTAVYNANCDYASRITCPKWRR